jgi:putative glycosyltransferase (TIGR04348 family)
LIHGYTVIKSLMKSTHNTDRKPVVALVTPALAKANNGNWHTAARWAELLRDDAKVLLMDQWQPRYSADVMIALHARRSACSIAQFAQAHPGKPIAVVLTGTDVYRDIATDTSAQQSLQLAHKLVILQERAADYVPACLHYKLEVIEQSAPALAPVPASQKPARFTAVMVGHLREEKAPLTFMRAAARLRDDALEFLQIGAALDVQYEVLAKDLQSQHPHYHWLGNVPRDTAREHIRQAHLLVIPSVMEGGAHVIIEALRSGTPVLASRVSGNVGMLGEHYAGYFELNDDAELAALLRRAASDKAYYQTLQTQCDARAPRFAPSAEREAVIHLLHSLFNSAFKAN